MTLNAQDLHDLCQLAIKAASHAGTMIYSRTQEKLSIKSKLGGTSLASQVFTEVDIESERLIIEILKPSLKKHDLALLSEETPDNQQRFVKDYFWCIDPLDGTLPYIEQQNGYSVSIALVANNGTPVIGVIYDPTTSNLYHAIKGNGAYKNGVPWQLKDKRMTLTLICDRSFIKHPGYNDVNAILNEITSEELQLISHGGAAMNAIWVLENHPAVYFKLPKKEQGGGSLWDYAASACIFKEINASATDFSGCKLDLNKRVSTFMNEQGIFYSSSLALQEKIKTLLIKLSDRY